MIRPASLEDLGALEAIEAACFGGEAFPRTFLRSLLTNPSTATFLAIEEETPVGSGMVAVERGAGRILSVAVVPRFRGGGLGRAFMETMEAEAARRGATVIELEVGVRNEAALGLYEGLGYAESVRLPGYYGAGKDAVLMVKRLTKDR